MLCTPYAPLNQSDENCIIFGECRTRLLARLASALRCHDSSCCAHRSSQSTKALFSRFARQRLAHLRLLQTAYLALWFRTAKASIRERWPSSYCWCKNEPSHFCMNFSGHGQHQAQPCTSSVYGGSNGSLKTCHTDEEDANGAQALTRALEILALSYVLGSGNKWRGCLEKSTLCQECKDHLQLANSSYAHGIHFDVVFCPYVVTCLAHVQVPSLKVVHRFAVRTKLHVTITNEL